AGLRGPGANVSDVATTVGNFRKRREQEVTVARGEVADGGAESGVHRHRAWHLKTSRATDDAFEPVILSVEIKRLRRDVSAFDDAVPLRRLEISLVAEGDPEHRKFLRIPAADDVQSG